MNEEDLNTAFHDVMVRSTPPTSMDPAQALDRARRTRKRRRATLAAVAAVPLAVAVGAGPALIANYTGHRSAGQMVAGEASTTVGVATPSAPTSQPVSTITPKAPTTRKSGDPWPEGQTDRTATAGPRADRAVTLMHDLRSSVPSGFGTADLKYPDGRRMSYPQSQYASSDGETDYWEYAATIPVQKGDRVGQLLVQSTTPNGKPATDQCTVARGFWGGTGTCALVDVGGKKVAVLTTKGSARYDQWAAYRYDDGTVVILAQTKESDNEARSPLSQPVFTARRLAELVLSPRFKISS